MSQFTVLVITPSTADPYQTAKGLLDPFSEQLEVPPYEQACWCIGQHAKARTHRKLEETMPIEKSRREFSERADVKALIKASELQGNYGFSPEVDALWKTTFVDPFESKFAELLSLDPEATKPDPECVDCKGTGVETTTYNPNTKWDWYELGGGNKWHEAFQPYQNQPVSKLSNAYYPVGPKYAGADRLRTFAVITPDGVWHEKGKIGWLATYESTDDWEAVYDNILSKYPDHTALIYNCHI